MRFAIFFLIAVSLAAGPADRRPGPSAAVFGVVVDSAQQPLRDVEVGLISLDTGRVLVNHTDIAGAYGFNELPTGRYSVSFELNGYATARLGPYELLPDSPREVAAVLEPLAPPLTRPRAGIETIALEYGMVREQIAGMPVLLGSEGRTATDKLLLLVPGLTPVESLEVDPNSGRAAAVSANGSRRSAINYQLDGASNNAQNRLTGAQAATYAPTPEALETFRVVTHTYSAAEGRNSGAVVRATTRSGGESWHGGLRGYLRPHQHSLESYDGSSDSMGGWMGGGQIGGPLLSKRKLFLFADAEGWATTRRQTEAASVLSLAERSGDLSGLASPPLDPFSGAPFPNGIIPQAQLDPLMQKYLGVFLPEPNAGETLYRGERTLDSSGKTLLTRLDKSGRRFSLNASHLVYRNDVLSPLTGIESIAPGTANDRRQLSNSAQISLTQTLSPDFVQTTRLSGQRLSIASWLGNPDVRDSTANNFGFDFASFGVNPGTLPDLTLYDDAGFERLRIGPFISSEESAQTTWQIGHDLEWRHRGFALRAGALYENGGWPFKNTENFAGSFSFPAPPEPPIRSRPNGLRNLLLGLPGQYQLQTPRDLNLRWRAFAAYGEGEIRPFRGFQLTLGLRFESQPPAVDTQDRIAAFRTGAVSARFPDTLRNLIFPGDQDGDFGALPRSTVETNGRNFAPRIGLAWSPTGTSRWSRVLLGESGRSVLRASYGQFYDFGAFAGSSAAALFQATYPPFSVDNRFRFNSAAAAQGAFSRPFGSIGGSSEAAFRQNIVRYPLLVFDRDLQNARAHQWNLGLQRLLPGGVFVSAVYVGTRSLRLQRQRELNTFVRNPLFGFASVRSMRLFSSLADVRQFESTGDSRYNGLQLRANRYLRRGLAFDIGYVWSRSDDNGSSVFGENLVTENWTVSNFDRRHNLTATWVWEPRLPRSWPASIAFLDRWSLSGVWRWRSGLPLDIRQSEDPTFSFTRVGRPDIVGEFGRLDPSQVRTFTYQDGRTVTGRFAFDPTVFRAVAPTDFSETRQGNLGRNAFRMQGFQQWDLRLSRPFNVSEQVSSEIGFDFLNVFGNKNWAAPFANINDPYFGVVRSEGVNRTVQFVLRLSF